MLPHGKDMVQYYNDVCILFHYNHRRHNSWYPGKMFRQNIKFNGAISIESGKGIGLFGELCYRRYMHLGMKYNL